LLNIVYLHAEIKHVDVHEFVVNVQMSVSSLLADVYCQKRKVPTLLLLLLYMQRLK